MPKRFEIFNKIPLFRPKRNAFNLSAENKLTTDLFRLTPFYVSEALPDDVFRIRPEVFCRTAPFNTPVMHRFDIRTYFFFVPNRLIWDEWEDWINPKSGVTDIVPPKIVFDQYASPYVGAPKTLGDYLGVNFGYAPEDMANFTAGHVPDKAIFAFTSPESPKPLGLGAVSALPFRAYQKIYQDWFIDLNNVEEPELDTSSGTFDFMNPETPANPLANETVRAFYNANLKLRYRAWMHDYFTSAMPEPQRGPDVYAFEGSTGETEVEIQAKEPGAGVPFTTLTNDIRFRFNNDIFGNLGRYVEENYSDFGFVSEQAAETWIMSNPSPEIQLDSDAIGNTKPYVLVNGMVKVYVENTRNPNLEIPAADIASQLTASGNVTIPGVTVEELRIRMQMQSFLERNEIAGSRYTELLYAHWGVKSPDGRLQRAEFLGGSKQPLMINEVTQFSESTDEDPLGTVAANGTSSRMGRTIKYRVPEHGFIIGLMCVVPRSGYSQGCHPMWFRFDRLDYYWPEFAHLGEQEVKNREIMFTGKFDPDGTFGYQMRNADYKVKNDEIHGDFKGNMAFWHASRMFQTPTSVDDLPKLSEEFTTPQDSVSDDLDRIFPVKAWPGSEEWLNPDHFLCDIYTHVTASRRMPKFVIPRNGS